MSALQSSSIDSVNTAEARSAPTGPRISPDSESPAAGRYRVLVLSTLAFTLMFAVWLQFAILGLPIQQQYGLSDTAVYWLLALPVLNGAIWRLGTGILADRFGGRLVMVAMLLVTAVPTALLTQASSALALYVLAFLIGFAGNSFSVGIAWNSAWFPRSQQGFALGVFGAGNVGASLTKLIGPGLIAATAGSVYLGGLIEGGWQLVPVVYTVLLVVMAACVWFIAPSHDRRPGAHTPLADQLRPLRESRVWRFSVYYVAVFGAYVALASALPKYYETQYDVPLWSAALLTALFIFPASLLRPVGGWMSDKLGARRVMYGTFAVMLVASGVLMMPSGFITVRVLPEKAPDGTAEVLPWSLGIVAFTMLVFLLGCAMGIGKAAVYKHIPEYFPHDVGAVGGLVGMLGALGGFVLLPLFGYAVKLTGIPTAIFGVLFVLTLCCAGWMHLTVWRMLHARSPELANNFDNPAHDITTSPSGASS
jgi:MFS transporter, NNP family, nitrate/nitrite transporter